MKCKLKSVAHELSFLAKTVTSGS